jgi:hypothetical protein
MNNIQASDDLLNDERELFKYLLLMTGREDRLERTTPLVQHHQLPSVHTICSKLRSSAQDEIDPQAQCDLFNRLLLNLSIMPVSQVFFDTVFDGIDFADDRAIEERVESFRKLCMLEYGNFRYGYKQFRRDDKLIEDKWNLYFPSSEEADARKKTFQNRIAPELMRIQPFELFALGDLDNGQEDINSAREELYQIFEEAAAKGVSDFRDLRTVAEKRGVKLTALIARAGLPGAEDLVDCQTTSERPYFQILTDLQASCRRIDQHGMARIWRLGTQNANTYMAMQHLDVYVATSMRAPLHFTTNWTFVKTLFLAGELSSWKPRYFDPTQTYLPSRIQMGLLECLMIKRTKLTVYHAQESDTFGKDCEAGVTLAQAKPVVVFVTRLFDGHPKMEDLYASFDAAAKKIRRKEFFDYLKERTLLTDENYEFLISDPEKSKADAIAIIVEDRVLPILQELGPDAVEMELIKQGYAPPDREASEYALERIIALERRALTFRDVHPLALQASPMDGVARGVIVTRTIADTAKVVAGLLAHTLNYELEIDDQRQNWLLLDSITSSPVRVVTKDPMLTSAFWSEKWGSGK